MPTILDLEKLALRVLCHGTPEGSVKQQLIPILREYHWQSQLHQVIFNAISECPSEKPEVFRQLLPAKLTRMGFPDVEWDEFFAPHTLSMEAVVALVERMRAGS